MTFQIDAALRVTADDNGRIYNTRMVARLVGICVASRGDMLDESHNHNNNDSFTYGPSGELVPFVT